jgi:hypothetical protein
MFVIQDLNAKLIIPVAVQAEHVMIMQVTLIALLVELLLMTLLPVLSVM